MGTRLASIRRLVSVRFATRPKAPTRPALDLALFWMLPQLLYVPMGRFFI